jgi:copper(I)-binding protein
MKRLFGLIVVLAALILPFAVAAQGPGVEIKHPWSRATFAKTGAAYLTIHNKGGASDALIAVSSPTANKAMVHRTIMEEGVMKMRPALPVELAPGATVKLAPGGLHVMLMGLKAPLKEGEVVPITLTFENAGAIAIEARVGPAGAADGGHGHD